MPPSLVSIEIGNVDASTIVATFSEAMTAFDYTAGVVIRVNRSPVTFTAQRQANHAVVHFTVPECTSTDVVDLSYTASPLPDTSRVFNAGNLWTAPDWR